MEGQAALEKERGSLEAGCARWAFALCLDLKLMNLTEIPTKKLRSIVLLLNIIATYAPRL